MRTTQSDTPAVGRDAGRPQLALDARGLSRSFGATRALVDGNLVVHQGETVALLGENGSGKSTLVKILSGVIAPDSGTIMVDGVVANFSSPRSALRAGIVTVFQEILVAPDRSVLDNVWLGNGNPAVSRKRLHERRSQAQLVFDELVPDFPSLTTPVRDLDLMQRQVCAIVRALLRSPKVLVLDESTSALDVSIRDRFFEVVRGRQERGLATIFISHRMDEVLSLADRFVGLRSGSTVGDVPRAEATEEGLIAMISGDIERARSAREVRSFEAAPAVIEVEAVQVRSGASYLDLTVRRGEIIGLAGLEGHGQDQLLRALAGLSNPHAGSIWYRRGDERRRISNYRDGVRHGVAYVPRDRKIDGLTDVLSIIDNYALPTIAKDAVLGVIRNKKTRSRFRVDAARVNFVTGRQPSAGRLSGGNQQKLILARWLAIKPDVLLLNDPTRGVDLRTKRELYELFRTLADEGMTTVLLSTEVEELVGLTDRVVVYHAGSCSAILSGKDITRENLVSAYFGVTDIDGRGAA